MNISLDVKYAYQEHNNFCIPLFCNRAIAQYQAAWFLFVLDVLFWWQWWVGGVWPFLAIQCLQLCLCTMSLHYPIIIWDTLTWAKNWVTTRLCKDTSWAHIRQVVFTHSVIPVLRSSRGVSHPVQYRWSTSCELTHSCLLVLLWLHASTHEL